MCQFAGLEKSIIVVSFFITVCHIMIAYNLVVDENVEHYSQSVRELVHDKIRDGVNDCVKEADTDESPGVSPHSSLGLRCLLLVHLVNLTQNLTHKKGAHC